MTKDKIFVPPIKSQGIKTKLVPWIKSVTAENSFSRWVEPFMGTGVVAFNVMPKEALLCDTNPHLINFYKSIQDKSITSCIVKEFLEEEGDILLKSDGAHYYTIRERFNEKHSPLDFLFLNRAGFNGMIRFNKKGGFNIPFCKKPNRFAQAYVTKICNQVKNISDIIDFSDYTFKCQPFTDTINSIKKSDVIYCDPPYIDRHTDYFNGWNEDNEMELYRLLDKSNVKFILSTWHHNDYRENKYIDSLWSKFNVLTKEHFYHVGGSESNRSPMVEAVVINYEYTEKAKKKIKKETQLDLFDLLG